MRFRLTLLTIAFASASARGDDVASWIEKLSSKDENAAAVCKGIAALGPKGAPAIPALQAAHRRIGLSRELPGTIGAMGDAAVPELKKLWESNDVRKREFVILVAPGLGAKAEPLVPLLAETLRDKTLNDHQIAIVCNALKRIGPAAKAATPALAERLKATPVDDMRALELIETLGEIGPAAAAVVPKILIRIDSWNHPPAGYDRARERALAAAVKIGPTPLPDVIPLLRQPSESTDVPAAFKWIVLLGPAAKDAVGPLRDVFKKGDDLARLGALNALAAIGPAAKDSLSDVRPFLKAVDDDKKPATKARVKASAMQIAAAVAIAKIDDDDRECIGVLIDHIADDPLALRAIRDLGPRAKSALPKLKEFASTSAFKEHRVSELLFAIASVGPEGRQAIFELMGVEGANWQAISHYLGQTGKDDVPRIASLLKDRSVFVRRGAGQALVFLAPSENAAAAVPNLVGVLGDDDLIVRLIAIDALRRIGPRAKAAVPKLTEIARQPFPPIKDDSTADERLRVFRVAESIRLARAAVEAIGREKK